MPETGTLTALGSISGTSMDGIDVSIVTTDGKNHVEAGRGATFPYPAETRARLLETLADPASAAIEPLADLEAAVTAAHAAAIAQFMSAHGLTSDKVSLVGFHGQTIYHRPQERFTRQLGSPSGIAKALGIDTIGKFRHADVAAGGEGAPLAPLYHAALASHLPGPLMVLNLGGVGNVTYIEGSTVIAFDTGPASALIDDWMLRRRGLAYDAGGELAASGKVDAGLLAKLMDNPFFVRKPPKSLDRNDFHRRAAIVEALSDADGAATLAAFTIASVTAALDHVPGKPKRWLVTGGGRHNAHFMRGLAARLAVPVEPVEAVGWNGDYLEAQCFGYLAVRSHKGLPLSLPSTTGVPYPMLGGELAKAA